MCQTLNSSLNLSKRLMLKRKSNSKSMIQRRKFKRSRSLSSKKLKRTSGLNNQTSHLLKFLRDMWQWRLRSRSMKSCNKIKRKTNKIKAAMMKKITIFILSTKMTLMKNLLRHLILVVSLRTLCKNLRMSRCKTKR